jgi:thiamine-monophosphate kinase
VTPPLLVADLGERALIDRIRVRLGAVAESGSSRVVLGIGDDAAVVVPEKRQLQVLTTDVLVDGVHTDLARVPARLVGRKAMAVNLSDVASMGARPGVALVSLGLRGDLPIATLDALVDGIAEEAARHRVAVVGGNITRTPGPVFVDVTLTGSVHPRRLLTRNGGRPGHELYVSGVLGGAAAGLRLLQLGHSFEAVGPLEPPERRPDENIPGTAGLPVGAAGRGNRVGVGGSASSSSDEDAPAPLAHQPTVGAVAAGLRAYACPQPRVKLGLSVASARAASACVDLSDGLGDGVRQLADASGTGAAIELDKLPLHPALELIDELERLPLALGGGEDYELLFAVPPRRRRAFLAAVQRKGLPPIQRIGVLTSEPVLRARRAGRDEPLPSGFVHFG